MLFIIFVCKNVFPFAFWLLFSAMRYWNITFFFIVHLYFYTFTNTNTHLLEVNLVMQSHNVIQLKDKGCLINPIFQYFSLDQCFMTLLFCGIPTSFIWIQFCHKSIIVTLRFWNIQKSLHCVVSPWLVTNGSA